MSRPATATAAADCRRRELGITAAELADRAGVPLTTVRYFGLLSHDRETLERLSVALGWPPEHLRDLWDGQEPAAGSGPGAFQRPGIEAKLDLDLYFWVVERRRWSGSAAGLQRRGLCCSCTADRCNPPALLPHH